MNKEIPVRCKGNRELAYREFKTFQGNLKEMSRKSGSKLRASILKYGWCCPVFVWDGNYILDGHGRLLILADLLKEGYSIGMLPVVDIEAASKKEAGEILLAINSKYQTITGQGLYEFMHDMDIKFEELEEFELPNINMGNFGDEYFNEKGLIEDDEMGEVKATITQPNDLWLLGEHRLLCGDINKTEDITKLMNGKVADCVWTDPPYGVAYKGKTKKALTITNDEKDNLSALLQNSFTNMLSVTKPGGIWYVMAPHGPNFHNFASILLHLGIWRQTLVWRKNTSVLGHSDYHYQHEAIFYGWNGSAAHAWYGRRDKTTVEDYPGNCFSKIDETTWSIKVGDSILLIRGYGVTVEKLQGSVFSENKPAANIEHPTMKPIALIQRMISNSSIRGEIILDPFIGSGSTLIACQKRNRICYGMEIDPYYCDIIIKRWEDFTGKKAKLQR